MRSNRFYGHIGAILRSTKVTAGIACLVAGALLASCSAQKNSSPVARPGEVLQIAFITSVSGDVQFRAPSDTDWKDAVVGQSLPAADAVRTGDNSTAEVQIADKASVVLEEKSTLSIENVATLPYSLKLVQGTVVVRVAKLTGAQRLRILSGNSVISVHGTRFLVSQTTSTQVAVTEGTVSLLPTGIDPADLLPLTTDSHLREALANVSAQAIAVSAGHQVELGPEIGVTERLVLADVSTRLSQISKAEQAHKKDALTSAGRDLLGNLLTYIGQKVQQELPKPDSVSATLQRTLESAGPLNLLPVPASQGAQHLSASGLASVTIRTDPEDAEIYLGDRPIGKRIFSGLFDQNQSATFTVKKPGFADKSITLTFTKELNQTITVTLEKLRPAYDPETFLRAVSRGDMGIINRYLDSGGNPNVRSASGLTAIALSLGADRADPAKLEISAIPKVLERLLSAGADPNAPFKFSGQELTPLYLVLASGLSSNSVQYDLLETLLKNGADPNIYVQTGNIQVNSLSMAIIVGIERKDINFRLLATLLKFGAKINSVMVYQGRIMTPLVASVVVGAEQSYVSEQLVDTLIADGADVNGRVNIDGQIGTPLFFADEYGFTKVAELLKKHGAVR